MPLAYTPLREFVSRQGGIRVSMHGPLRDQLVDWCVEEFPLDAPPERMREVLSARVRLRAREEYGSVIAALLISVLAQLIVKLVIEWWKKTHSHRVLMIGWQAQIKNAKTSPNLPRL